MLHAVAWKSRRTATLLADGQVILMIFSIIDWCTIMCQSYHVYFFRMIYAYVYVYIYIFIYIYLFIYLRRSHRSRMLWHNLKIFDRREILWNDMVGLRYHASCGWASVWGVVWQYVIVACSTCAGDLSKVVSTHLWNTSLNLYQQAIMGFLS